MINIITHYQPSLTWEMSLPQSEYTAYIFEILNLSEKHPEIIDRITVDLDLYAKDKKLKRIRDQDWEKSQKTKLPGMELDSTPKNADGLEMQLESGRPRKMTPIATYLFLMSRGYMGAGVKSREMTVFTEESRSLQLIMNHFGMAMAKRSTISENINCISEATLNYIMDCQLAEITETELDDYKELYIDSTAVSANSCFPKESDLMYQLMNRMNKCREKLNLFGLEVKINKSYLRIEKLAKRFSVKINMECGKPKSIQKRRKWYRKIYQLVNKFAGNFEPEMVDLRDKANQIEIFPSKKQRLLRLLDNMQEDLKNLSKICQYSTDRIMQEIQTSGKNKKASVSDFGAAFIVKGQRDTTIGYKPQIIRSRNGFVTEIEVPKGNTSDSDELLPAVKRSINRTSVIPSVLSADDGYTSYSNRKELLELGIKTVSFSGSKGKKITPVDDWESSEYKEARNQRSSVESLMFTIKHRFDFNRVLRRGHLNVRKELLEKVLAYNFCRMISERQKKELLYLKVA